MEKKVRILIVCNVMEGFLLNRLPLAIALRNLGYDVHIACSQYEVDYEKMHATGFVCHFLPLRRHNLNIIADLKFSIALLRLYRQLKPDLIHHFNIKPVIYGTFVAYFAKQSRVVNTITGLGSVFIRQGHKAKILRIFVEWLYRFALWFFPNITIFQNPDDQWLFLQKKIVKKENTRIIKGSGVDVQHFVTLPEPTGDPVIALIGRILWDKGIGEFVAAARILQQRNIKARFVLVGDTCTGNPSAISLTQLQQWVAENIIEWWGWHEDMLAVLKQVHILCLPSYREGVPKVLLEGAACAKPIVTTDTPGCREVVIDKVNGFLIPIQDVTLLSHALEQLINAEDLRKEMGCHGRKMIEEKFSLEKFIAETLEIYEKLTPADIS